MYIVKRGRNCEYVMTAQLVSQQMIESVNYDIEYDGAKLFASRSGKMDSDGAKSGEYGKCWRLSQPHA